jgi:hypothetical protein
MSLASCARRFISTPNPNDSRLMTMEAKLLLSCATRTFETLAMKRDRTNLTTSITDFTVVGSHLVRDR